MLEILDLKIQKFSHYIHLFLIIKAFMGQAIKEKLQTQILAEEKIL
jgi:hypothetical protein